MFDFSTLEAELTKIEGYISEGASLDNEVPAVVNVAMSDLATVKSAFGTLKSSVTAASAAVAAAIPAAAPAK